MEPFSLAAVVLCAGKGTRMKSELPKVLHPILGRPLCWFPLERAFEVGASRVVAVVGHQGDAVRASLAAAFEGRPLTFATQASQRGTGDAVASAKAALAGFRGAVLILCGDVPLITADTVRRLLETYRAGKGPLALITCHVSDATGYGRIVRRAGKIESIVEHKDATAQERAILEVNAGMYVADAAFLVSALDKLSPRNAQGELYLTDIVAQAAAVGEVGSIAAPIEEALGVNDRVELAERARVMRSRINEGHMRSGVTLVDPATTFIDEGVEIGPDTTLGPNVTLRGNTEVGTGVRIGQGCVVEGSTVGDGSELKPYTVLEETVVGPNCHVGPFTRCRPATVLEAGVHLGNFVETKKTRMKKGAKAGHLSYLGDAEVGQGTNIGAGTITCNYDGVNKHVTTIGDEVFIGSDTQLVAPVKVGDRSFVAAGTTVTHDVPADALVLSRTPQTVKEGWAAKHRLVLSKKK